MDLSVIGRFQRSRSEARASIAVLVCAALMSACGSSASRLHGVAWPLGTKGTGTNSAVTSGPASTYQSPVIDQVASGWLAAEGAFADAARTSDPFEPELAATTLAPQLGWTRSLLEKMSADGLVATGPVHYGTPQVTGLHGAQATVRACAMDAEIVVSDTTGRPVPGILGQVAFELFTSKMQLTEGEWKLASQSVGEGQCDRL